MNAKLQTDMQTQHMQELVKNVRKGNFNCKIYKKHLFPGSMEDSESYKINHKPNHPDQTRKKTIHITKLETVANEQQEKWKHK